MEDIKSNRDKIQRIKSIIEREIEKELISKQNEVSEISEKIKIVLRNLDILKYIAAVNYYDTNTTLTQKKGQDDENEEEKAQAQTQLHPCIKKLLPFKSNYNKCFGDYLSTHSYETRNSKKLCESATVTVKKEVDSDAHQEKCVSSSDKVKIPQYIPPLPSSDRKVSTPSRGHVFKENYRIVVGNISKWIPPDMREDTSTHKWMVYVRDKDSNKDVTKLLRKVRYFLHESYQPHDIIDVTSAPFHLTRRGWGEFPIRVQLHFIHPLNKPVDIIHNLKLDMTCSGIQMLGAETVVEVSLHQNNSLTSEKMGNSKTESNSKCEMAMGAKEKQDVYDGSLLTSINGIKPVNCYTNLKTEEDVDLEMKIKQEPEDDEFEDGTVQEDKMEEINIAINNNKKFLLDRRKIMRIIEIEHDYLKKDENDLEKQLTVAFTNSILKLDGIRSQNACKNGAVLDALQLSKMIKRKREDGFSRLELWRNKSEEEIFRNLLSTACKMETEAQLRCSPKVFRQLYMVNILQRAHATNLKTVEPLLRWFAQRWPIVTKLSSDPIYKNLHPYSCPSEEEFFSYNIGKQRSAEWFRAKAIQKVLTSLKAVIPIEEEIWSTKQILLWSRFHGYSPASPRSTTEKGLEEERERERERECQNKRLKLNESSSDSDEGVSDNSNKRWRGIEDKYLNGLSIGGKKKNYKKSRRKEVIERTIERHKNYKECNTYTPADDGERFGAKDFRVLESRGSEDEIEVIELETKSVQESPSKKREVKLEVTTIPTEEVLVNKFVTETARQIGIKITEEEVIPGVVCDSVSRVLTQCAFSFMDELLRRSLAQAWLRCGERCPDSLESNDILATLMEHSQFDIFTNRGLGMVKSGSLEP